MPWRGTSDYVFLCRKLCLGCSDQVTPFVLNKQQVSMFDWKMKSQKFQLYKQTHLEIHWSAVRIWGKGQFSNLRPLASSKPRHTINQLHDLTQCPSDQARWCFRVKHLYYQLLLYALSQNLPDSGLRRKNELIHVQDMVEKWKQVNTYVRNMQNCNCFHISIYLLSF